MAYIENVSDFTQTQYSILQELSKTLVNFGAKSDLMSIVGSWGDTMSDDTTLEYLKEFNSGLRIKSKVDYDFNAVNAGAGS